MEEDRKNGKKATGYHIEDLVFVLFLAAFIMVAYMEFHQNASV